jgi:hypothetical protein
MLLKRKYTDSVKAPCPPVVSRAKGEKTDPVAAQRKREKESLSG